ncbi:MAG TPA: hypothetical protein VF153_05815 [Candidatus Limnocylindria bacterium]
MTDDGGWHLAVDPPVLVPDRRATFTLTFTPSRDLDARGVSATLRCVERYRYDDNETSMGADGKASSRTVTRTVEEELHRGDFPLAGAGRLPAGRPQAWTFGLDMPGLGPATFEGEELRCDWILEAKVDLPMALDERFATSVRVAQPTALLKAGVVDTGQYGLFEEAPTNVDAFPAQIRLEPVPICQGDGFTGRFTVETAEAIEVQEVRLELRVHARVVHSGGHQEEILVQHGHLATSGNRFGGEFATHPFTADAVDAWLPSIDLPHGTARGIFHVILARAWASDIHYVRDVALATTRVL